MDGKRRIRRDAGAIRLVLSGVLLAVSAMAWADTTPAAFNFRDVTVADQGGVVSNVVTVRGIDEPTLLQVTGDRMGPPGRRVSRGRAR
jgi:hypothetical protein